MSWLAVRARPAARAGAAAVLGLLMLGGPLNALAQSPRFGSAAWYNGLNAQRGAAAVNPSGGSGPAANIAPNSPAGSGASVAQSIANFSQAARAIAQAQAAQAQAAQTQAAQTQAAQPLAGQNRVPDGLTPGGLWVSPAVTANAALWSGAKPPVAAPTAASSGAVGHTGGIVVTVNQTAKTADLTWTNFNVGANTTLQFNQGGSNWSVLNRVVDPTASPSQILGAISAPGQVLVLNRNGILFGAGSQTNVGSLVASTADLAQAQFSGILSAQTSAGAYIPVFTSATAPVIVQAGAAIATNAPASATQSGGFVLLLGQSVSNAGQITTPSGQTVLAAGRDFVIRPGYSADNNPTSTTLGLEVAPSGSGSSGNTGLIQATTGDITLTGESVTQAGVLLSSTTVNQRGTIHLLTNTSDTAASITFAPGSVTAVQPENDGTTATNTTREALIAQSTTNNNLRASAVLLSNQAALPDQQYQSRIEVVSGGTVEFQTGALGLSTGGQIAVQAAGRFLADTGATLSAAGSVDTVLPATANTLQISVQGYDLRDSPNNRDSGALTSHTMNVAINPLVQIGSLQYTSGGLLEVSGYVAGVGHTIGEWTSLGGTIGLSAAEVVAQPGAQFNIAGGQVTYAAGTTANTWLTGPNGHLYNVNSAPSNITYTGIYNGFTVNQPRWGISQTYVSPLIGPATSINPAYTVGRDAGTLTIDAPTVVMEAAIVAGVSAGGYQNAARPAGVTDPFTLAQTVVPLAGTLIVGPVTLGSAPPVVSATDVLITQDVQPLAASLALGTPVPASRTDTAWLSASLLNDAALGGLTVVTQDAIRVDAPLTLSDGGSVSLLAPSVVLSAPLTARGGSVTIGNYTPTYATPPYFLDATDASGAVVASSVTLGPGSAIETAGVFTNLAINPGALSGSAFVNGGPVSIDSSGSVFLASGSVIDASAGGVVSAKRAVTGGSGGAISITAFDPNDPNAPAASGPVSIGATLRAFGSGTVPCTSCAGGALTLTVPAVWIGGGGPTDPATVSLPATFFAAGFSNYTITGQTGVTVAPGTQISVVQPILQTTAATALAASGADPAAAFATALPALYTPNLATAALTQRAGASVTLSAGNQTMLTGGLTVGTGSSITVDPARTITLQAQGQIAVNGALSAPGGGINILNEQYLGTSNSLSIWIGGDSVLDVSAQAATAATAATRSGDPFGSVPAGGAIHIGGQSSVSTNAFVVIEPGAVLRAAGASAVLDPNAAQTLSGQAARPSAGPLIPVASNGGAIALDSESGILLGGQVAAPSGGPGAPGGIFSVSLVTPNYTDPNRFPGGTSANVPNLPAYQSPRELVVGNAAVTIPAGLQPGSLFPDSAFGQGRVSAAQIAAGGFDAVNLSSGDAILFDASTVLTAGRSVTLATAILGSTGGTGAVTVSAPYVTLAGSGAATLSGLTFQRQSSPEWRPSMQSSQATLQIGAANIDVSGNLYVGVNSPIVSYGQVAGVACPPSSCPVADLAGFASTTLSSSGDIRFLTSTSAGNYTTLTTSGNLSLVAGQVYPIAGTNAFVTAGFAYDAVNRSSSYNGTLSIAAAPGPVPQPPLTAGGILTLRAGIIQQGGVLRAPDGQITLGTNGSNGQVAPVLAPDAAPSQVVLLPGGITSVSMNGLSIPFGGTSDGTTYTLNGAAVTETTIRSPMISLLGQSIQVQPGAVIDISGGGTLAGAGFVPGRGGSYDVLQTPLLALTAAGVVTAPPPATNLVFAIVPGFSGSVAAPPATATPFSGPLPAPGDQITLGAGVPGLAAGTYTLLPGSDALQAGAFRVQLATTVHTVLPGASAIGNGSYLVNGYRGVAKTAFGATLPVVATVTPGSAVRLDASYNETNYAQFALGQSALFGQSRATLTLPADAKTLAFAFPAATASAPALALQLQGSILSAPGPSGLGGIVEVSAAAPIEVIAPGAQPTAGFVSLAASDLSSLHADTLVVGGTLAPNLTAGLEVFASATPSVTVREAAALAAAQVFLVSSGGITIERGAAVNTIGQGVPSLNSSTGLTFSNNNATILAVSNGAVSFQPATLGGPITIGSCGAVCAGSASLFAQGTIATVTTGAVTLDPTTQYGASAINLSASVVNFGTPPAGAGGLTFTADILRTLVAGDSAAGVPGLQQLTLTASQAANFYGQFSLDTRDPATGQSSLQSLQINTPAIYGAPGVNASLTTGTFIWNGVLLPNGSASLPPAPWTRGGGSGTGTLAINANTIVLGYGPADQAQAQVSLGRIVLGFDTVTLGGTQSIAGNSRGSLTVYRTGSQDANGNLLSGNGGDLTLATPVLTGAAGSVLAITAGGNLAIQPGANPQPAGGVGGQGASLTLNAAAISNTTSIVLPSGQLVMNAQGPVVLGAGSQLALAGVTTTLFGQTVSGWGGDVTLQSATAGITQASGAAIDVSAGSANAGTITLAAPGTVDLAGGISGSAAAGYTSGSFSVRAGALGSGDPSAGFAALNTALDQGGFRAARSIELLAGNLTIPAGTTVKAGSVSVSADAGSLTIAGVVDASGVTPGSVRLSAGGNLTLAPGAVIDAHGTVPQTDSYGQTIDSENTASVTLTSANGTLAIGSAGGGSAAPVINVSAPAGVTCALGPCGQITLNAPRIGGNGAGDVAIAVPAGVGIQGAGGVVVTAFQTYNSVSTITQNWFAQTPAADAATFMNAAVSPAGVLNAVLSQKMAGLVTPDLAPALHLRPGVEIDSASTASPGDLTVGGVPQLVNNVSMPAAGDLDLSAFRFQALGAQGGGQTEPGALVIRAAGVLTVNGSINDGFTGAPSLQAQVPYATAGGPAPSTVLRSFWELAQPVAWTSGQPAPLSWSVRLVAGADLNAADSRTVLPSGQFPAGATETPAGALLPAGATVPVGSIVLYDPHSQPLNPTVANAASFQLPGWSVIRTGTGNLDLLAGGSINELSTYAIYTAGASPALAVNTSTVSSPFNLPRGLVPTPLKVTFTGKAGKATTLAVGTLVSGTSLDGTTTTFATTTRITLHGASSTSTVVVPVNPSSAFDIPVGAPLALVNPVPTIAAVKATSGLNSNGSVLGAAGQGTNNGVTFESLVGGYSAWYPQGGGNLLISAGGAIAGYLATPTTATVNNAAVQPMDGVGAWLWRQGGTAPGAATAWWINFGTLALPLNQSGSTGLSTPVPTLTGFTGIGTLGGGNVTILAGGTIGATSPSTASAALPYTVSQAIDVSVGSTGQVSPGAADASGIVQTGGGLLTVRSGGALNGGGTSVVSNQANGTLTDTRGSVDVAASSIGQIALTYGAANFNAATSVGDPRATSPLVAAEAVGQGGPILVLGDAAATLQARGDLVLAGAGDPGRLTVQNLTPAGLVPNGSATGLTWFSLWQPATAIHLESAGGNIIVSTQAIVSPTAQQNAIPTDYRFMYPATLTAVAASGSIYAGTALAPGSSTGSPSSIELAPAATGQLELIAAQSVYGDSLSIAGALPQSFDVSGASPSALPSPLDPAFVTAGSTTSNLTANIAAQPLSLFAFGADTATGTLHAADAAPALIYAGRDIVDLRYGEALCFTSACTGVSSTITPATWYVSGKAAALRAGGDIVEPGTILGQTDPPSGGPYTSTSGLIVNNNASDVSLIEAGGEVLWANAAVAGPGQLYVQAGGPVYQANQADLVSLGPLSNGVLSAGSARTGGAGITVLAGAGPVGPNWQGFAQTYLAPAAGYIPALLDYFQTTFGITPDAATAPASFEALPIEQQRAFLLQVYFDELRASGREFTDPSSIRYRSYARGRSAIEALFPAGSAGTGDLTLYGNAGIRSDFGGTVTLLAPGGGVTLGNTVAPVASSLYPAGVLTQGTGNVDIFSQASVILGQSRVFTTFGGSIVIWSATGDIDAGRGSKTTQLVSTSLIQYDPFGQITLTPGIPTSGAGIATLAPIPGTPAGDVDLIAPLGVIDAGEAGIRVSGNANLAALTVVNAANVQVGGRAAGVTTVAAPNVSALSAASATAAATAQSAQQASTAAAASQMQQVPSTITLDVIGFGDT